MNDIIRYKCNSRTEFEFLIKFYLNKNYEWLKEYEKYNKYLMDGEITKTVLELAYESFLNYPNHPITIEIYKDKKISWTFSIFIQSISAKKFIRKMKLNNIYEK